MTERATQAMADELAFDAAMEDLQVPDPSNLDIENGLDGLNSVHTLTPDQAKQVLALAAQHVSSWIKAVGAGRTLHILNMGPIFTLRHTQEGRQTAIDQPEVAGHVTKILAGMVAGGLSIRNGIRDGYFGQPAEVLVGTLGELLSHRPDPEPDSRGELSVLALMLSDLVYRYDNPDLIERIKTQLPVEWLMTPTGDEVSKKYPTVRRLLEKAWSTNDPERQELASRLLQMGPEKVEVFFQHLKEQEKQPGVDAFDTLVKVFTIITADSPDHPIENLEGHEEISEAVWVELLETDRSDPRLRPLRHRLIGKEWYWDEESVLYTLLETFNNMGIKEGDELPFIIEHEQEILTALNQKLDRRPHTFQEGLERTAEKGEFAKRLQVVIAELRKVATDLVSVDQLTAGYPDELLFAALWSPVRA